MRILIVDDEETVRINLVSFFEDEGYEVLTARSGEESIEVLQTGKPDICIVDMRLPGMDGNTLILKMHELLPGLKFLIHTGSPTYNIPYKLYNIGIRMNHVLKKPVGNMNGLLKIIQKLYLNEQQ